MSKKIISTKNAPVAIGPYSQAVKVGETVFCSGQIALNPETGNLVTDSIEQETRQVLNNLQAVLSAAGAEMQQVVKVTVFLSDMNYFTDMNEIYSEFFPENPPARACVEAARLPKDVNVEIEAIAVIS